MPSNDLYLFTDGSVDPSTGLGCGVYLAIAAAKLGEVSAAHAVQLKHFEKTSASELELLTFLWALSEIEPTAGRVTVCTDSQTIVGLPGRRARLEANQFRSKKGRWLHQHTLYEAFFAAIDRCPCQFVKVRGHAPSRERSDLERRFKEVDTAARAALRHTLPPRP